MGWFPPIPSDTIGVLFEASYHGYSGSAAISGPTVIAENIAEEYAAGGILAGIAYLDRMSHRMAEISVNRSKLLIHLLVLPILVFSLPLTYLSIIFPPWYGKGWAPASLFGVPDYWIAIIPGFLALASYLALRIWPHS